MKTKQMIFNVSGDIKISSDIKHEYLVNNLNENVGDFQYNIKNELREKLHRYIAINEVYIDISFEQGSIIVVGTVVIDYLGKISGAIAFFEYVHRLLKSILQRRIKNHIELTYKVNSVTTIQITPVTPVNVAENAESADSENIFKISPSKLLLAITTINIVLFIGGTLFNIFQVASVQKRYSEAEDKIKEAKSKYEEINYSLKQLSIKYQSDSSETGIVRDKIIKLMYEDTSKANLILSDINTRTIGLLQRLEKTNSGVVSSEFLLKKVNTEISKLNDEKKKFSFKEIFPYLGPDLKVILFCVLLIPLIAMLYFSRGFYYIRGKKWH